MSSIDYFTIKQSQIEMVKNRGYDIPAYEEDFFTKTEQGIEKVSEYNFQSIYENKKSKGDHFRTTLNQTYEKKGCRPLMVVFLVRGGKTTTSIASDDIKNTIKWFQRVMNQDTTSHSIILIGELPLSNDSTKRLDEIFPYGFQFFQDNFFMKNIINHMFQPKYEKLSMEEKGELYKNLRITSKQLERSKKFNKHILEMFQRNDPVVKYYNWQPGDVIRVIRDNFIIEKVVRHQIAYRIVGVF
jgi:DNA-directed RNA polymerase subunit H (RpoH/RPB5)